MKKLLLISTAVLGLAVAHLPTIAQGTWTQEANFGGGLRAGGTGFTVGAKGYFATGGNASNRFNDLWEYDPSANVWSQMANLPSNARVGAVSFSIGLKGYVGLGKDTFHLSDFWEYDPSSNSWTQIANFTGASRSFAVGFSIGNKGYIGTGYDGITYNNDFWQYNPISNVWTQLTNFPGTARTGASGFVIGGNGYIGLGTDLITPYFADFWKYDTTANSWTGIASFPGPLREGAIGFCIGNEGYISSGGSPLWPYNYYTDLWKYNSSFNFWGSLTSYTAQGRRYSSGFVIDSCLYIGTGCWSGFDPPTYYINDFWKYCINIVTSVNEHKNFETNIFPNPFSTQTTLHTTTPLKNATLTVYNSFGQQVKQFVISRNEFGTGSNSAQFVIRRDNLPSGLYFLRLTEGSQTLVTEKLIITD